MVPYGTLKTTINYTVFDPLVTEYQITNVFDDTTLSGLAVLVYVNDVQLVKALIMDCEDFLDATPTDEQNTYLLSPD